MAILLTNFGMNATSKDFGFTTCKLRIFQIDHGLF